MPFPKSLAVRFALGFGIGFIGLGVAVGAYVVVSAERPEDASLQSGLPNPTIQPVVSAAAPTRPAGTGTTTMPAGLDFSVATQYHPVTTEVASAGRHRVGRTHSCCGPQLPTSSLDLQENTARFVYETRLLTAGACYNAERPDL